MVVMIHADDLGLTSGITDGVMESCAQGPVNSVSLVMNGLDTARAFGFVREHRRLNWSVHLNLVEGRSVADPAEVPLLVNRDGYLKYSFLSLWLAYLLSGTKRRDQLKHQVSAEIRAQLRLALKMGGAAALRVDGHQHTHMIPFVLDALIACRGEFRLGYVRLPCERLYLTRYRNLFSPIYWLNVMRNRLLYILSKRARVKLCQANIPASSHFVGILHTGRMTLADAIKGLRAVRGTHGNAAIVEVLFHPGGFADGEEKLWPTYEGFLSFYRSKWRKIERATLVSDAFKQALKKDMIF